MENTKFQNFISKDYANLERIIIRVHTNFIKEFLKP